VPADITPDALLVRHSRKPPCDALSVDRHERMWQRMLAKIEDFRTGAISLRQLVDDVRGLYVEAAPHDAQVTEEFEEYWCALDVELARRTEPRAPGGAATEQSLRVAVGDFEWWAKKVSDEHGLGERG
jgi:hypothetical protein